jgi:voltage-gated potassium channel
MVDISYVDEEFMRRGINLFFEKHEAAWEMVMIFLAVVFILIAFLPDWFDLDARLLGALEVLDWAITGIFIAEFAVRFWAAESRSSYLREHWLDLLAIVPVLRWLRLARVARILRVLRILRLARVFDSLDDLGVNFARFTRVNDVHWLVLALVGVMLAGSAVIYLVEVGVNPRISGYGDALYASLLTWLGPGLEQLSPVTVTGKITCIALIVAGLAAWGILISNLAAFFTVRAKSPAVRSVRKRLLRLDELSEAELLDLKDDISEITEKRLSRRRGKKSS